LGIGLEGASAGWGDDERHILSQRFQQLTLEEALDRLGSADIWAEPCLDVDQIGLPKDQRLINCGIICQAEHPVFGDTVQVGTLFRLSRSEMAAARHAPLAGEHTTTILEELGYSSSDIARFYREKTVA
jgi:crotonobetainyl-CoA:carnitine CoA-transferase CaiB-like acyl-CoA transferase